MTEIVGNHPETQLLANGNIRVMPQLKKNIDSTTMPPAAPPLAKSRLSEMEEERIREERIREQQFCDMILHVLERIEKDSDEDVNNEELMSETSLWDLKSFLKGHISVAGVSEHSPINILESVNNKLTSTFHDFNFFDIGHLAACTKVETEFIAARAKNVLASDVLLAVEDAKSVMNILRAVRNEGKEERKDAKSSSWSLSQMTNLLHIKSPSKKLMGQLSPKSIRSTLVDVFVGQSSREAEDIDSFQTL